MPQPTAYTRQADFTSYEASNPSTPKRGEDLDAEFDALKVTTDEVLDNLALIQRDDGALANASVHPDALSDEALALMGGSWEPRGAWVTATLYSVSDVVSQDSDSYVCAEEHTSGTFATDLAAGKWIVLGVGVTQATLEAIRDAALAAQAAAETAETNAETAETNAETAATNAANSASAASTSATNAATAETNAETAETNAEAAQAAAEAARDAALAAQTAAETAETNAETAETNAEAAQAAAEAAQAAAEAAVGVAASEGQAGTAELATDSEMEASDGSRIATAQKIGGWIGRALTPGGRLTLTSATPVTNSDVTAAATIYYALYGHNLVPLWDGTRWRVFEISELSLALNSNSGHTGYHQSGKNFDVFIDYNAGTPRLVTGPAWTSDTARADAIARKDGRWTNNASMTVRFGTASGDTATMAANTGLYVGSIRCTANGQTEDSAAKRFVWNTDNRRRRKMMVTETANTWTYTTAAVRQANNNTANQLDFLIGLSEDMVYAKAFAEFANTSAGVVVFTLIDMDGVAGAELGSIEAKFSSQVVNLPQKTFTECLVVPAIGRHYLSWLEYSVATGTTTWFGDDGGTNPRSGIVGEVWG